MCCLYCNKKQPKLTANYTIIIQATLIDYGNNREGYYGNNREEYAMTKQTKKEQQAKEPLYDCDVLLFFLTWLNRINLPECILL